MVVSGSPQRWDRWHSPSPNWQYIPLIYHLYIANWGGYMQPIPPFRGTRNNHWIVSPYWPFKKKCSESLSDSFFLNRSSPRFCCHCSCIQIQALVIRYTIQIQKHDKQKSSHESLTCKKFQYGHVWTKLMISWKFDQKTKAVHQIKGVPPNQGSSRACLLRTLQDLIKLLPAGSLNPLGSSTVVRFQNLPKDFSP